MARNRKSSTFAAATTKGSAHASCGAQLSPRWKGRRIADEQPPEGVSLAKMRTTTFTLTDGQMASLATLFEPLMDAFVGKVADRVRQLQEEAKPRYYTRAEVANLLHVSLPTLHAMVNARVLTPRRVGGRVLFPAAAVDEGIASGALRKSTWTKKGGAR